MKKFIIRALLGNKAMMVSIFLEIAKMLARESDNEFDDEFVATLEAVLNGSGDASTIERD